MESSRRPSCSQNHWMLRILYKGLPSAAFRNMQPGPVSPPTDVKALLRPNQPSSNAPLTPLFWGNHSAFFSKISSLVILDQSTWACGFWSVRYVVCSSVLWRYGGCWLEGSGMTTPWRIFPDSNRLAFVNLKFVSTESKVSCETVSESIKIYLSYIHV